MTSSNKVPPSHKTAYERWELPSVVDEGRSNSVTASQVEQLQKQAYDEGFSDGYKDGFSKGLTDGQAEVELRTATLSQFISALHEPFTEMDDEVIAQVGELAMLVARQLIRRELHIEPDQIVAVVREAVSILPANARNIRIYLHPDDMKIVRDAFAMSESPDEPNAWQLVEEPLIERGGCKVHSENSTIDATIEQRLNKIIASVLGNERGDNHAEP